MATVDQQATTSTNGSGNGHTIAVDNPATGQTIGHVADMSADQVAELVARAREAGVRRLATVGTNGGSIQRALSAAEAHDGVVAIVGRHPHYTAGFDADALEEIERAAADPRARAIGELAQLFPRVEAEAPAA